MKLTLILFLIPFYLFGQVNPKLRATHEIYWCGIDFSQAKMIGSKAFRDSESQLLENIRIGWNDVIFGEPSKYNLKDLHKHKSTIAYREVTDEINKKVEGQNLIIDEVYEIRFDEVKYALSHYPIKSPGTIGLTFMVESFNSLKKRSYVWAVFFDMNTQEPIIMEKYVGVPGGKGLLNYWANSFEEVVDKTLRDFYYYK